MNVLQRFPQKSPPIYALLEQLPNLSCKISQTGWFEVPFHFQVYVPLEELPSRCLNSPSWFSSVVVWLSVTVCSHYNKIACRRCQRPTPEHPISLPVNGPLESPSADTTSLSKLKVLLTKYNLITYMHCHYNLTRENIHLETAREEQAEACMGNTLHSPMEL